jgi:hypothetical protein
MSRGADPFASSSARPSTANAGGILGIVLKNAERGGCRVVRVLDRSPASVLLPFCFLFGLVWLCAWLGFLLGLAWLGLFCLLCIALLACFALHCLLALHCIALHCLLFSCFPASKPRFVTHSL